MRTHAVARPLALALLAAALLFAAARGHVPRLVLTRGVYASGFEWSELRPCGSGEAWWLDGNLGAVRALRARGARPTRPGVDPPVAVRVLGWRSVRGRHGHVGAYPYRLTAWHLSAVRADTAAACT